MKTAFPSLLHDSGKDEQQPVFAEPWEAHAFAIAVKLSEKGLLKSSEWTNALAEEIKGSLPNPRHEMDWFANRS